MGHKSKIVKGKKTVEEVQPLIKEPRFSKDILIRVSLVSSYAQLVVEELESLEQDGLFVGKIKKRNKQLIKDLDITILNEFLDGKDKEGQREVLLMIEELAKIQKDLFNQCKEKLK